MTTMSSNSPNGVNSTQPARFRDLPIVEQALFLSLILAILVSELMWAGIETGFPHGDPYAEGIVRLTDALRQHGLLDFIKVAYRLSSQRPPLYSILVALTCTGFGRSLFVMSLFNIAAHALLMWCSYLTGKLLSGARTGILSATLVASCVPILRLNRVIMSKCVSPLMTGIVFYCVLRFARQPNSKNALLVGIAMGLSGLVHPFLLTLALPSAAVMLLALRRRQNSDGRGDTARPRALRKCVLAAGIPAAGLCAVWYLPNWRGFFALVGNVTTEWRNVQVGFSQFHVGFWWYALTAPYCVSWPLVVVFVASLFVIAARRPYLPLMGAIFAVLHFCCISVPVSTRAWHDAVILVPSCGVIAAYGLNAAFEWMRRVCDDAPRLSGFAQAIPFFGTLIVAIFAAVLAAFSTWGFPKLGKAAAAFIGAQSEGCPGYRLVLNICPDTPSTAPSIAQYLVEILARDHSCRRYGCRIAIEANLQNEIIFYARLAHPELQLDVRPTNNPRSFDWSAETLRHTDLLLLHDPISKGTLTAIAEFAPVTKLGSLQLLARRTRL